MTKQLSSTPRFSNGSLTNYHKKPITSVEWHPNDAGVFMATCEDDQASFWDITLDHETGGDDLDIPVQLLFIHSGQKELKEAHWHPQIPGLVFTTALDGYNVFRTCNI
ncbi:unnamed protein product [Trichobilharzia regenti]|nr:unnamed protein product [Trichobilharzia regenti]